MSHALTTVPLAALVILFGSGHLVGIFGARISAAFDSVNDKLAALLIDDVMPE